MLKKLHPKQLLKIVYVMHNFKQKTVYKIKSQEEYNAASKPKNLQGWVGVGRRERGRLVSMVEQWVPTFLDGFYFF